MEGGVSRGSKLLLHMGAGGKQLSIIQSTINELLTWRYGQHSVKIFFIRNHHVTSAYGEPLFNKETNYQSTHVAAILVNEFCEHEVYDPGGNLHGTGGALHIAHLQVFSLLPDMVE